MQNIRNEANIPLGPSLPPAFPHTIAVAYYIGRMPYGYGLSFFLLFLRCVTIIRISSILMLIVFAIYNSVL
jgi:hypothetical protein